jgi:hypothetical protein
MIKTTLGRSDEPKDKHSDSQTSVILPVNYLFQALEFESIFVHLINIDPPKADIN